MRICSGYTYPTAWSRTAWLSLPPPTRGSSGDKKKRSGIMSRQAKGTESHSKDWVITLQRLSLYSVKSIESTASTVPILFLFTRMVTDYHGFSLSRIIELSNFSFHTDGHGLSRVFFFMSRIIELSNFFSHGVPRRITDLFFFVINSLIR